MRIAAKPSLIVAMLIAIMGAALAKLPPPTEQQRAAAADAAAKSAWNDKMDAYRLCLVQDKIAAQFRQRSAKPSLASADSTAMTAQGTTDLAPPPSAQLAPPPCAAPAPFVAPSANKPLEASGAHSPPDTAATAPSSTQPASDQAQKK